MSDYLERLERQLVAAVEEGAATAPAPRGTRGSGVLHRQSGGVPRSGGGGVPRPGGGGVPPRGGVRGAFRAHRPRRAVPVGLLAAALALLLGAAVALAITGVLAPGSVVRPATKPVPSAGTGVPLPGRSRLIAQAPDPAGGPPWGMRLVRTTRGLECVQLGRVENGQLGVLGIDGAFRDDGRFHPLPPEVLGRGRNVQAFVSCQAPGQHMTMEAGLSLSGAWGVVVRRHGRAAAGDPATSRWISFGLLGPRAVSVSYPADGRLHTQAVAAGSGAYLIALPNPKPNTIGGGGGASGEGILSPQGAVSLIAYRVRGGGLCGEPNPSRHAPHGGLALARCPRPADHFLRLTVGKLHHPIAVRRLAGGDLIVTFTAPYAVSTANDQYSVQIAYRCHRGTIGIPLDRDVRAGEVVHMRVQRPFALTCGASLTVQVDYQRGGGRYGFDPRAVTVVGEARVARR